jgi:hypothetical protein
MTEIENGERETVSACKQFKCSRTYRDFFFVAVRNVTWFRNRKATKMQFGERSEVFWVVTPCSDVGYQRSRGPCCLHQSPTTRCHNPEELDMKYRSVGGFHT